MYNSKGPTGKKNIKSKGFKNKEAPFAKNDKFDSFKPKKKKKK